MSDFDSEDDFHAQREKVLLKGLKNKFHWKDQDETLNDAYYDDGEDDEVLPLDMGSDVGHSSESLIDDDEDSMEAEDEALLRKISGNLKLGGNDGISDSDDDEKDDEDDPDRLGWGKSRKAYYDSYEDSQDEDIGKKRLRDLFL